MSCTDVLQSAYGDVKVRLELPPGVPLVRSCVAADSDRMQISTVSDADSRPGRTVDLACRRQRSDKMAHLCKSHSCTLAQICKGACVMSTTGAPMAWLCHGMCHPWAPVWGTPQGPLCKYRHVSLSQPCPLTSNHNVLQHVHCHSACELHP